MRIGGLAFVVVVLQTSIALAQPQVEKVAARDPKLAAHLKGWQNATAGVATYQFEMTIRRTDPAAGVFKGNKEYKGAVIAMKPNYFRIRLANPADPKDFEAIISDGKSLFVYNGLQKTITELKPGNWLHTALSATWGNNPVLGTISGDSTKSLSERCDVKLFKEDEHYIYLDIKPKLPKDKMEFQCLRLALYGPKTGELAYLPAQVYTVKPTGETEQWRLTEPKVNIAGITEKQFQYENIPGFRLIKAKEPEAAPIPEPPSAETVVVPACGTG